MLGFAQRSGPIHEVNRCSHPLCSGLRGICGRLTTPASDFSRSVRHNDDCLLRKISPGRRIGSIIEIAQNHHFISQHALTRINAKAPGFYRKNIGGD
jgi:hypothetical protein